MNFPRLGINIDHVATLRQLRHTPYPKIVDIAKRVELAGAHQITVHLREDRRHIQDQDVKDLRAQLVVPLNLEMAVTASMVKFAKKIIPDWACFVPEKRQELTTEGGLDVKKAIRNVAKAIEALKKDSIRVSLFIEPSLATVKLSHKLGADAVELHTGRFAELTQMNSSPGLKKKIEAERKRVIEAATLASELGLHVHAGHGLDYENVRLLAFETRQGANPGLPLFEEFNIGHSIICRAVEVGIEQAVHEMASAIQAP